MNIILDGFFVDPEIQNGAHWKMRNMFSNMEERMAIPVFKKPGKRMTIPVFKKPGKRITIAVKKPGKRTTNPVFKKPGKKYDDSVFF